MLRDRAEKNCTWAHVRILPYGSRHFRGQKCIAVIERNVSLFANASDYSNKTYIFCKIQARIPVHVSLVGVVTTNKL